MMRIFSRSLSDGLSWPIIAASAVTWGAAIEVPSRPRVAVVAADAGPAVAAEDALAGDGQLPG